MGDGVKRLMDGYLEELEGRPARGGKPVTFSIRLSEREHARLIWLARSLGTQKTPLAEKLLKAALDEAIGQYAEWAAPEDPEGFLEEALANVEDPQRGSSAHDAPGPPGHEPPPHHHGPRGLGGGPKKRPG